MASYDLHRLGWHSFQKLCLTILREIMDQTVESYLDSNDGGRDGGFVGTWKEEGSEAVNRRFVVQCKFTGKTNENLSVAKLSDEIGKARRLVERGFCDVYILMSNAGLSGSAAAEITEAFQNVGVKEVKLLCSTWINQQIDESKRLRMLVPRIYGLGDLSQILDERAYAQAEVLLASMREDLAKVVLTKTYSKAASALEKHGFVLLIGEPAAGKTTIASLLAMAAIDQWGATPLKLDVASEVIPHWNPHEPSQFFWIDDAFGVTQYESHLVHDWNRRLPQVKAMVAKGARVVMTSRDYIYNRARSDLKASAFPLLMESQVVVDVHNLSLEEKEQILYNHLKLGSQSKEFLGRVKPHLTVVAKNQRFVPEVARRLAEPVFTEGLTLNEYSLVRFVESQEGFLIDLLESIDSDSKACLALIHIRNGRLSSPVEFSAEERTALERLNSTIGGCCDALNALDGSLVRRTRHEGQPEWTYQHPTIGDAYAKLLARDPELLDIFLLGSATELLLNQVTCGDVGLENAIILAASHYDLMITKLGSFVSTTEFKSPHLARWSARWSLNRFLGSRCDKKFLSLYLQRNPSLIDDISHPGLMLSYVSEIGVACQLHEFGLLPEEARKEIVGIVSQYAIDGEDLYGLWGKPSELFTTDELDGLKTRVLTELVPRLDEVRQRFEQASGHFDGPEDQVQPFIEVLDALEQEFPQLSGADEISKQRQLADEWIEENRDDEETPPRLLEAAGDDSISLKEASRSIFDDIDV